MNEVIKLLRFQTRHSVSMASECEKVAKLLETIAENSGDLGPAIRNVDPNRTVVARPKDAELPGHVVRSRARGYAILRAIEDLGFGDSRNG